MNAPGYEEERRIWMPLDANTIEGSRAYLTIPAGAHSIVVFANDRENMQHIPRSRYLAEQLRKRGIATLLTYLLTPYEEGIKIESGNLLFDLGLLTQRLIGASDWLQRNPETQALRIGYFGVGTGVAAALIAAAARPKAVHAVVSRSGRPELATMAFANVRAPTLMIVAEHDPTLVANNQHALEQLTCPRQLEVVPQATRFFPEAGTLDMVAGLAGDWFKQHLADPA